mgnify:CR=1 FL=1
MLELCNITKSYNSHKVLDNISINFRKKEFVSIIGPSGSGKTTLLNIIGGLDKQDKGDFFINGKSTKKYKDKDYDKYRNKKVSFVFQNYNLINHLNILQNIELSLTIKGINKKERKRLSLEALDKVGLKDYYYKKPYELSGGEQERVAIARAIVNDSDIILADEPTGALDPDNSLNIIKYFKELSKYKLVIMVTHNTDMAYKYSDRIIELKNGSIISDTDPYEEELIYEEKEIKTKKKNLKLKTCLFISIKNLLTKKYRTLLIIFANSIGILGILLILSISNGINSLINDIDNDLILSYPIMINKDYLDTKNTCNNDICIRENNIKNINLYDTKLLLESKINNYINDIKYDYNIDLNIYDNTNKINNDHLFNLINNLDNKYDIIYGKYPINYDELVLIINDDNSIDSAIKNDLFLQNLNYDSIINKEYKLVFNKDLFIEKDNIYKENNDINILLNKGINLKIVGIIKPKNDNSIISNNSLGYTNKLIDFIIDINNNSKIVRDQLEDTEYDIFNNKEFNLNDNLDRIGYINLKEINNIKIYPNNKENKDKIIKILDNNNINYEDNIGLIMNAIFIFEKVLKISLIGFISISLIVSNIMMSILVYINTKERKREIGILRSIGSSKKDIKRIFNSETFIIGLLSGLFSILINYILINNINNLINKKFNIIFNSNISFNIVITMIIISIILTVISGLIPSKIASKNKIVNSLKNDL